MKALYRLLISLWTLEGLLALSIAICFMGSLIIPANLAFFSGIDDTPLFVWLNDAASPAITWWIFALMGAMGLLALSTILCTIDALIKATGRGGFMLKLFPQVIHMGVLLVMLGYLLTAWLGTKEDVLLKTGQSHDIGNHTNMTLTYVAPDAINWEVRLDINKEGQDAYTVQNTLRQVSPAMAGGAMLFIKSVTLPPADSGKDPSALIRVCRDPGAMWALAGGLFVVIGGVGFMLTRRRGLVE